MKQKSVGVVVLGLLVSGFTCARLNALDTVVWGGGNGRWENSNWILNGSPGVSAVGAMGDNTGGRGGKNIVIGGGAQVEFDPNNGNTLLGDYNKNSVVDASDFVLWRNGGPLVNEVVTPGTVDSGDYTAWRARFGIAALGDYKPRMDLVPGGSVTVKEGAVLYMNTHSDDDGRWARISLSMTLDNGTLHREYSAPSKNAGRIMFGYSRELLKNQHIDINLINGGRIESASKMVFGNPDYFIDQGGSNNGHMDGIEVAMTIDNGSIDLTLQSGQPDYDYFLDFPFALIPGDLLFAYEYHQAGYDDNGQPAPSEPGHPRNEKYSINFTGPGSITLNPHDIDPDPNFAQIAGGIYVIQQQSDGSYIALGGGPDLYTPIGYHDLWDLGILQANGQSGLTLGSAAFSTYFSETGTKFAGPYILNSLIPAGSGAGLNGGAVPEPASVVSLMVFVVGACAVRRRRGGK
jgi:hypothetical protein